MVILHPIYSIGIMAYEMLVGICPFNDDSPKKIFKNVKKLKIDYPEVGDGEEHMSPEAYNLIKRLLEPDPLKRLGRGGTDEIKKHKFFRNIKWKTIREQEPPFVPACANKLDTTYFNAEKKNFSITFNEEINNELVIRDI